MNARLVLPLLAALCFPGALLAQTGRTPPALQAFSSDAALRRFLRHALPEPPPPPPPAASTLAAQVVPGLEFAVVTGRVTDSIGTPQAAVLIRIESLDATASTGADGTYRLLVPNTRFQPGWSVQITAARAGLATVARTLTLHPGAQLTQNFTMASSAVVLEDLVVTGTAGAVERQALGFAITNTQHAGVDEGGIVKLHGDHLVILRRGRLFTVDVHGGRLAPVDAVDAFAPGAEPGEYYDEMLISGDNVVVLGYSWKAEATEINLFGIDARGRLRHRSTYHMRSADYYSSGNYATRLLGNHLVLYTPVPVPDDGAALAEWMPGLRRWHPARDEYEDEDDGFRRILPATRVYRPGRAVDPDDYLVMHTVTTCEIARGELECEASAVLGPEGRVFYVSPTAVYVWVSEWSADPGEGRPSAMLYRLPLDGGSPTALGVEGSPVDQFSFLESPDRHLNVVVRDDGAGDAMWGAEHSAGAVRLLRVPLDRLGGGRGAAPRAAYRPLPMPRDDDGRAFQNRFVGAHLLYGLGTEWGRPRAGGSTLYAVPWRGGPAAEVAMAHGIDRIEAMGADAVVVGADTADLYFTGVRLGRAPRVAQRYVRPGASQGETRSHGFFYRQDGEDEGVIGLPIRGRGRPGFDQLSEKSSAVLYLRNQDERFRELGELVAKAEDDDADACQTSCDDWYGNSRPVFLGERVFALMGYEIVEGELSGGRIREVARASFAPRPRVAKGR
jgi:Beta propeller domain/Carboxypeptidase regulatory-like domain